MDFEDHLGEEIDGLDMNKLKCWNCDLFGHRYQECLAPRRVFCYGCGRLDTYKPNCQHCMEKNRNLNFKKDVGLKMGPHPLENRRE